MKPVLRIEKYSSRSAETGKVRFYWRVKHRTNGKILCDSAEGYSREYDRDHALGIVIGQLGSAEIKNLGERTVP